MTVEIHEPHHPPPRPHLPPRLSRPPGPGAAAGSLAGDHGGGPPLHPAHAAHREAFFRAHDGLRAARLGVRRDRLPLPARPSRHGAALARHAGAGSARLGGAERLSASAGRLPDQFLRAESPHGNAPGQGRGGVRRARGVPVPGRHRPVPLWRARPQGSHPVGPLELRRRHRVRRPGAADPPWNRPAGGGQLQSAARRRTAQSSPCARWRRRFSLQQRNTGRGTPCEALPPQS